MTNTDTQRSDERVSPFDMEPVERERYLREFDSSIAISGWNGHVRFLLGVIDAERARAERAEADRDDIAASYSRVLMHITDGALSMPSTEPQMAIAVSDDLDTERWNAEMSEYEARAERAEQREARLREALASVKQCRNRLRQILVNHGYDTDAFAADEGAEENTP